MVEYIVEIPEGDNLHERMSSLELTLLEKGVDILGSYELIPAYHVRIQDEKVADELREQGYEVSPSGELHIQR